jgi:hypothetical protein
MATERKIGGVVYRCDPLPAEQALDMLLRVSKFFAAYPEAIGSITTGTSDADAPGAFLPIAMSGGLDDGETKRLMVDLVQTCRTGNDPCVVGVKPQGLVDLLAVAWFAMEVNFKDFLSASVARA